MHLLIGTPYLPRLIYLLFRVTCHSKNHVHSLSDKDPTMSQYQLLLCFCVICIDGMVEGDCVHKEHVFKWTLTQLKPKNSGEVRGMMYNFVKEIEVSTRGEWIAKNLFPNDNVVVPTLVNEPFRLMLVDKGLHVVATSLIDGVGNE